MRELDRQLDEARQELADLKEPPTPRHIDVKSSVAWLTDDQMDELWCTLKDIWLSRPYMKEIHQPATLSVSELRERLQLDHYGCRSAKSIASLRWTNLQRLERAMIFEESESSVPRRDPTDQRHIRCFSSTIESMVKQLMRRAESSLKCEKKRGSSQCPSFQAAQELLDQGYPRYSLSRVDPDRARQNTINLNNANRAALKNKELPLMEKIGQICYNLLVSAYPPDMHTFNTLILGFDKLHGYRAFSDVVIYNFIHKTYLRPSPTTYAAILYHSKVTKNHLKFLETISRLVGLDGITGAKVRNMHLEKVVDNPRFEGWATDMRRRTITGDYVWEHAPLNRLMVEEAISGFLHFHMFVAAVSLLTTCMRTGVLVSTRYINQVLDECLLSLDWSASVRLIQDLTRDRNIWPTMLKFFSDKTAATVVDRIYSILDLIGLGVSAQPMSYEGLANLGISSSKLTFFLDQVHRTNLSFPCSLSIDPARGDAELPDSEKASQSRLLQIESLSKEVVRTRQTIKSIESKLLNAYHLSPDFCASMALYIGSEALDSSQRLAEEVSYTIRKISRARPSLQEIEVTPPRAQPQLQLEKTQPRHLTTEQPFFPEKIEQRKLIKIQPHGFLGVWGGRGERLFQGAGRV